MFGLMRAKTCSLSDEQKEQRRLHYCGTCKTIGAIYNHKARFLLDHDAVFLAEVLTALGGENIESWQPALYSFNCLRLPINKIPVALEFAATANVVLAEFKIKDQLADTNQIRWRLADSTFAKTFTIARRKLENWQFPFARLEAVLDKQTAREKSQFVGSPADILHFLAAPTAEATGLFFANGAQIVGSDANKEIMFELGFAFGKLIYLLDAYTDYEKDVRDTQFNAFRAAFDLEEIKLSGNARRQASEILRLVQDEIRLKLDKLPIASDLKQLFTKRLNSNLARLLKTDLPILGKTCSFTRRPSFAARWQIAQKTGGELTAKSFATFSWKKNWQYLPIFIAVWLIAFAVPHEAAKAKSWQDCTGLSFNLIFLASLAGAILALPIKMAANIPPELFPASTKKLDKRAARYRWYDGCHCDSCCDCGEISCCGCNCCDGCDCSN